VIRKLLQHRRPPPERDGPSRELIGFYSVDEALEHLRDQALVFGPRRQRFESRPDLTAKVVSMEAVSAMAWCRSLNAFPESDVAAPGAGYRGWIQTAEDSFIFVDGTGRGRWGRALPPDVDPASVPRVSPDRASTPGRDALEATVDRVKQALAHGWAADNANEVLAIAHRVLDREATLRTYGEHYKSLCHGAAKFILEGVTPDHPRLDDATLAERLVRADAVMEALLLDAEEAYAEFRADGAMYTSAFLAREIWSAARAGEGRGPFYAVAPALIAGADAELPEKAAEAVSTKLLAGAYRLMSEDVLDELIDRIEETGDQLRTQALEISPPDHRSYFDALYRAVIPIRGWRQLAIYLDAIDEFNDGSYSDGFRRRIEQSLHVAEELRARVDVALRVDAEDWSGRGAKEARTEIRQIRDHDGESAARLAVLERTIHTFQYPRSIEPYLLGEVDNLSWKETLP
jgi:hypothetical protein